jgi:hypothetical protein
MNTISITEIVLSGFLRALWGRFYYVEKRSAVTVVDSGLHDTFSFMVSLRFTDVVENL